MLKFYTFIVILFVSSSVNAQKRLEKIFDATSIETIQINGDGIYNITVNTSANKNIILKAKIEGETFENVLLTDKQQMESIILEIANTPFFVPSNDKLAAHKILAIELFLSIPKNKNVIIKSNLANFEGSGTFLNLSVSLNEGNCNVINFKGNGWFQTLKGNIIIEADSNVSGTAISEKGNTVNKLKKNRKWQINAESKHGDIQFTQTEY